MGKIKEILLALVVTAICCWIIDKATGLPPAPSAPPEIKLRLDLGGLYFKEIK